MKISLLNNHNQTKYLSKFKASDDDILRILAFLSYSKKKEIKSSWFWNDLIENTFVGFSKKNILLKSGNDFFFSNEIAILPNSLTKKIFYFIIFVLKRTYQILFLSGHGKNLYYINERKKIINQIFNNIKYNKKIFKINPLRYLDYFYILNQVDHFSRNKLKILEIGGGLSIAALILKQANKLSTYINIDLPNQIITSYLILRSYTKLKIALPNEVYKKNIKKFNVILLLPFQKKLLNNINIDLALNVNSFQEMQIDTVNEYLSFIYKRLKKGGIFLSLNQTIANYIKNNNLNNYNIKKFKLIKKNHNVPFEIKDPIIKKNPILKELFFIWLSNIYINFSSNYYRL